MNNIDEKESKTPKCILDEPLPKGNTLVSLSSFSYILSEIVQFWQSRVSLTQELEQRLADLGYSIGLRVVELLIHRERNDKKEIRLIALLQFIHSTVWKTLFRKIGDGLEKSKQNPNEYYIFDNNPITNKYISVPKDFGQLNCAAFIAGIINGILDASDFPAEVTAHSVGDTNNVKRTVFIIKFEESVLKREEQLG